MAKTEELPALLTDGTIATADEERRLAERRRSADLPFAARPAIGSVIAGLDLLVLGVEPTGFLHGAYVQFLRVDGTDLGAPIINERRISTALPSLLRELDELLKLNIKTSVHFGDTRRPDYPLAALQQLARNAILHRSYEGTASPVRISWFSDRVEIYSPGGPYGVVTVENFGEPGVTDYRNPILAEAMSGLGYVQKFGAGLPIARRALAENGNPPAEFIPAPAYVAVIVRTTTCSSTTRAALGSGRTSVVRAN